MIHLIYTKQVISGVMCKTPTCGKLAMSQTDDPWFISGKGIVEILDNLITYLNLYVTAVKTWMLIGSFILKLTSIKQKNAVSSTAKSCS